MLWCQGVQNIGLSNHILKSARTCTVSKLQCTPVPDRRTDRRTNIMAIARRFVLTNASRTKMQFSSGVGTTVCKLICCVDSYRLRSCSLTRRLSADGWTSHALVGLCLYTYSNVAFEFNFDFRVSHLKICRNHLVSHIF